MTTRVSRQVTAVATLAVALVLGSGLATAQRSAIPSKPDERTVLHVLNRIGFGARPGDVARVEQMGIQAYIEQQLHPEKIADATLSARLEQFPTVRMSTSELNDQYFQPIQEARRQQQQAQARAAAAQGKDPAAVAGTPPPPPQPTAEQRMMQQQAQNPINELMQAKLLRETLSER